MMLIDVASRLRLSDGALRARYVYDGEALCSPLYMR